MVSNIFHRRRSATPHSTSGSRLGYLPGLDGLRALAVLAVLLYHADVLWLPGGFLGVEIFFVVSGYLITSLLLAEYRAHHTVSLRNFWQRRARRLLPALFALLAAVLTYMVVFLPDEVASLRGDVAAAFTYVTNWYLIAANQSYFEEIGRPSLLRHLWSLAVEEQFYVLFPLLFVFVLTRVRTRGAMLLLMLGATASALWMGALYVPDADPSRIYYGTDTRAAGILLGCALAFAWMPRAGDSLKRGRRWLLDAVGILALAGLVAATLMLSEFDPFLYQGGMLLVAAATALVIAAIVHPQSPLLAPLLGFGILRWIGLRSYSLYLWHWPVFMVTRPQLDTALEGTPLLLLRFGLTFALAELSYRLVETPIRNGGLGKAWNALNSAQGTRRWGLTTAWVGGMVATTTAVVLLGIALLNAKTAPEPDFVLTPDDEIVSAEMYVTGAQEKEPSAMEAVASSEMLPVSFVLDDEPDAAAEQNATHAETLDDSWIRLYRAENSRMLLSAPHPARLLALPVTSVQNSPQCDSACENRQEFLAMKAGVIRASSAVKRAPVLSNITVNANTPVSLNPPVAENAETNQPPRTGTAQVIAIGDSVMLGASRYLGKSIANVDVDAKLGRQVSAALKLLRERKDAALLAPIVIIHLGNNGSFSAKQFDEMMALLSDVPRVVFLTNKVPRKWQVPNNNALTEGVKRYPNAVLVDWNTFSAEHPEWFWKDGIHLRPEGAREYVNLIVTTLQASLAQ